ncbi:unnamed protein product [Polarella glacialis]|uniref:C2 domain-containing protein n=1 Tax=Polarella glacialis TaxID=89957 RepID=A0A813LR39_POLGL|nr:unnamed protein product [Polarella glacialis]
MHYVLSATDGSDEMGRALRMISFGPSPKHGHGPEHGGGFDESSHLSRSSHSRLTTRQTSRSESSILAEETEKMPILPPKTLSADLYFFRRLFSRLKRHYGDSQDAVPTMIFGQAVASLFSTLGLEHSFFDVASFDVNESGAVGWDEFVAVWSESELQFSLTLAERVSLVLEDPTSCRLARVFGILMTIIIFLSCLLFFIGSLPEMRKADCPSCEPKALPMFDVLEVFSVVIFSAEYLLRLLLSPCCRSELLDMDQVLDLAASLQEERKKKKSWQKLLSFLILPVNVIDLVAIAPFYLEEVLDQSVIGNSTVLRIVRLTRLIRLVKLGKYSEAFNHFTVTIAQSMAAFWVLGFYLALVVCFSSSLIFFAESGSWDPHFPRIEAGEYGAYVRNGLDGTKEISPFTSIPASFWWSITTLTTVGYGDLVPTSTSGKFVAGATMVMGILCVAMPICVISENFAQSMQDYSEAKRLTAEARLEDRKAVQLSLQLQSADARTRRQQVMIEIYDYDGPMKRADFLGEYSFTLPLESKEPMTKSFSGQLLSNKQKSSDKTVQGSVSIICAWKPDVPSLNESQASVGSSNKDGYRSSIHGELSITIVSASGLVGRDWNWFRDRTSDPFCEVTTWPKMPTTSGVYTPETFTTARILKSLDPVWDHTHVFRYDWDWHSAISISF